MTKRILSLLTAFLMVMALIPMSVFAKEESTKASPADYPAEPIAGYYFESDPASDGWTFVDADNDGFNWMWSSNYTYDDLTTAAYEGSGAIISESYSNDPDYTGSKYAPITPDNWAVSPAVDLPEGAPSVTFYATSIGNYGYEHIAVYAGTSADVTAMQCLLEETPVTSNTVGAGPVYQEFIVDLSAFAGETVYVAIRHFNSTDKMRVCIDQVEVWGTPGEPLELIAIHEVYVNGWGTPVEGVAGIDHMFLETPADAPYFLVYGGWRDETDQQQMWSDEHVFIAGHEYSEGCQIWCDEGYYFADDCVFYADGSQEILDLEWCYVDEYENYICYMNSLPVVCEAESPGVLWGDANGDGVVDTADVLLLMRYVMGLVSAEDVHLGLCDVNGDGVIDMSDALLIQRRAMDIIDSFPVENP